MKIKHRHKWVLIYTCMMPSVCGLLWCCEDEKCGSCLEFSKKPNYKKATEVLLALIKEKSR